MKNEERYLLEKRRLEKLTFLNELSLILLICGTMVGDLMYVLWKILSKSTFSFGQMSSVLYANIASIIFISFLGFLQFRLAVKNGELVQSFIEGFEANALETSSSFQNHNDLSFEKKQPRRAPERAFS